MGKILALTALIGLWVIGLPAAPKKINPEDHFQTSDRCIACHNGLTTKSGEDISIGFNWRATMMANSSRDPYWQAGVRREIIDHPKAQKLIEDECSICHMPMARYESKTQGKEGEVFAHLPFDDDNPMSKFAHDGVSCSVCHQIGPDKLGTRESFVGGFVVDTSKKSERPVYGPYEIDAGHTKVMRTSSGGFKPTEGKHIRSSEVCATCHTLLTKALNSNGEAIGELPEQVPYQEWLASEYKETKSCQSCHMPVVQEETPVTAVLGKPREGFARHIFIGGNFFMQRVLNKYRKELAVGAQPAELEAAAARTIEHLQTQTAKVGITQVAVSGGRLQADITIENGSGHKFPTAYPSRRAWLHVTVKDSRGGVVFESGALDPKGMIKGNDNDEDGAKFEPHYTEITSPDQVQIYESVMGDPQGKPTTGLLTALRFIKDNRLLPRGFDKSKADAQIQVVGGASTDADFIGGSDKIRYSVATGNAQGPFQVEAELWFQPISYRWANNLRQYNAMEPQRFVKYYDEMAGGSGVLISKASAAR